MAFKKLDRAKYHLKRKARLRKTRRRHRPTRGKGRTH